MCNDLKRLTKISELRRKQQEQYDEQSGEMLSGIMRRLDGKYVHPKRLEWLRRVCYTHVYTHFKACLIKASLGGLTMGKGFWRPGYELARHVHEYVEKEAFDELINFLYNTEDRGLFQDFVEKWLKKNVNHCFKLVPPNRKEIFIKGFIEYMDDTM
jgi:hypothetical protein